MTITANCQYDSLITSLNTIYGTTKDSLFDRLVLQAAQRLSGNPLQFDGNGIGGNTQTIVTPPSNVLFGGERLGIGND